MEGQLSKMANTVDWNVILTLQLISTDIFLVVSFVYRSLYFWYLDINDSWEYEMSGETYCLYTLQGKNIMRSDY